MKLSVGVESLNRRTVESSPVRRLNTLSRLEKYGESDLIQVTPTKSDLKNIASRRFASLRPGNFIETSISLRDRNGPTNRVSAPRLCQLNLQTVPLRREIEGLRRCFRSRNSSVSAGNRLFLPKFTAWHSNGIEGISHVCRGTVNHCYLWQKF